MPKEHVLQQMVRLQKANVPKGICSICSANKYVVEASLEHGLRTNDYVLIEATSNQVNQYGGYTGMKPGDFRDFVFETARKVGFSMDRLVLGGDHLGPNPWKNEPASGAMQKAGEMVRQYVLAGFSKIHLDASMALADDVTNQGALDPAVIADRTTELCSMAEEAYRELVRSNPEAIPPVYVIGTEVPIPGGTQESEDSLQVTKVEDFRETVRVSHEAFRQRNLDAAWERVIAVVVQPGVEFGSEEIHEYDREKAKALSAALGEFSNLVFEGHSTDYQTPEALKQMVEDGIAILKVGPALTFAMREGLFMLNHIEDELLQGVPDVQLSHLIHTLDKAMLDNPANWKKYYHGDEREVVLARKYSLSDRSRYYWSVPRVQEALDILIQNLSSARIPLTLISQYLPVQYRRIRAGLLDTNPESLIKDKVREILEDYYYAVNPEKSTNKGTA